MTAGDTVHVYTIHIPIVIIIKIFDIFTTDSTTPVLQFQENNSLTHSLSLSLSFTSQCVYILFF